MEVPTNRDFEPLTYNWKFKIAIKGNGKYLRYIMFNIVKCESKTGGNREENLNNVNFQKLWSFADIYRL